MPILDLSIDSLLTTTRSVRKRLDLARPVEPEVIRKCLELAVQAPTASNSQGWHFVVVTDPEIRHALATIYRKGAERYKELMVPVLQKQAASSEHVSRNLARMLDSGQYLIDHLHEVPVHVIPCIEGRTEHQPIITQAARWGSIMPAAWSFMIAARSRGLGSSLTSFHLFFEQEAAQLLGIPYEQMMQAGLIPVAYTLGIDFKPAARKPLESVLHSDRW
jgi:nitroreductase